MLVNGTPPSAINANMQYHIAITSPNVKIDQLPCDRYIRDCRTILRILGETLTAYRLAKVDGWSQISTDGTSRRQVALQNLVVSIMEDNELKPLILSSAIILLGESSIGNTEPHFFKINLNLLTQTQAAQCNAIRVSNGTGQCNFSGQRERSSFIFPGQRDNGTSSKSCHGTGRNGIFDRLSRPGTSRGTKSP